MSGSAQKFLAAGHIGSFQIHPSGIEASDHFREVAKTITAGKGAQRSVKDYMFTRYACYLIAQNSDPKKRRNCIAQSYFTVQTRKQEPIEERISEDFAIAGRQVLRFWTFGLRDCFVSAV